MKKTILILLVLMFCTRLFSLEESYVRKKIKGYYTDVSWNDYKIYPVTEDCSIVVGYIQREGAEGCVSLYDLQLVTDEKLSLVVSVVTGTSPLTGFRISLVLKRHSLN